MKYKELAEFFDLANQGMINYMKNIKGKTEEEISIYRDPEINLFWCICRAQELIQKAIKEYERIIKKEGRKNPAEIQKTRREIDDWIQNQNAKKSTEIRKKRTQNLILLGATFLPILPDNFCIDDSKIEKLREIIKKSRTEILEILDDSN